MMDAYVIRKANMSDVQRIAQIEREVFSRPWSENSITQEMTHPQAVFLVTEIMGKVVGYISMQCICGECYIGNLAVDPFFRRKKAASVLLEALLDYSRQIHAEFVTLEVRASNAPARALYEKYGFLPQGERKNYYDAPVENAVIYTLFMKEREPDENTCN